jgi:hypothetical protein
MKSILLIPLYKAKIYLWMPRNSDSNLFKQICRFLLYVVLLYAIAEKAECRQSGDS